MTDQTTDAVRTELTYRLAELETAIGNEDIVQAEKLLAQLQEQIVPGDPLHGALDLQQRALTTLKKGRERALEEEAKRALAAGEIEAGQSALDRLESLAPGHQNLAYWRERLAELERLKRQQEQLAEFAADLEERWKEAEEAEVTGLRGEMLVGIYAEWREIERGLKLLKLDEEKRHEPKYLQDTLVRWALKRREAAQQLLGRGGKTGALLVQRRS